MNHIPLASQRILLRPIDVSDTQILYSWRSDPSCLFLWSKSRRLITYDEFKVQIERMLRSDIDVWLMILQRKDKLPLGFIYNHDTELVDGHTFITLFLDIQARSRGFGKEAGLLFINYLMEYYPLRKIYADIYEYNDISTAFVTDYGFRKEGFFPEHHFFQGHYHAMQRMALYREDWYEVRNSLFPILLELPADQVASKTDGTGVVI